MTHSEFLFKILDMLDNNGIDYMLFAGTLLGAIREKGLLASDPKDTDIAIHEKDYIKLRAVLDNAIVNKEGFVYYGMWRKEVTVINDSREFKVDIFLLEEHQNEYYLYSSRPNEKTNRYNHEWRCKYPKNWFFPTQEIEFMGRMVRIPAYPERILEAHYGKGWTTPDTAWISYRPYNIDVSYPGFTPNGVFENDIIIHNPEDVKDITLIVPTMMRDDCLKRLITTAQIYYPTLKILVGYQGKNNLDTTFSNTRIIQLPNDCGLSYARNTLVKEVETEYTLLLDDDHWFHPTTDLGKMKLILNADENLGIVSGRFWQDNQVKPYEKFFLFCDKLLMLISWTNLYDKKLVCLREYNGIKYGYADICHNFFIAKTKVLREYGWDNRHKVHSEHLDFYLNLKINSPYKVAFIPDMIIGHTPVITSDYKEKRFRQYYYLITQKYGFEKGYSIGESSYLIYKTFERKPINNEKLQ
jgi:glycosyltransferase involved in cell wall biosynthesis